MPLQRPAAPGAKPSLPKSSIRRQEGRDAHKAEHLHEEGALRLHGRRTRGRATLRPFPHPLPLRSLPAIPSHQPDKGEARASATRSRVIHWRCSCRGKVATTMSMEQLEQRMPGPYLAGTRMSVLGGQSGKADNPSPQWVVRLTCTRWTSTGTTRSIAPMPVLLGAIVRPDKCQRRPWRPSIGLLVKISISA